MLQIMTYKERFGHYPQEVQADKIYLNRENRKPLMKLGIVCHCPPLGRSRRNPDPEEEKPRRKASGERNGVEATFGKAKRVYRANNIRAKLKETARTWIAACFFAKNLKKFLMGPLCLLLEKIPQIAANPQYDCYWWLLGENMCNMRRRMDEFI